MSEFAEAGVRVLDCEHKTPPDAGCGHPYVAIPNLVDGRLDLTNVRRITDEDLREWTRRTRPRGGDVIVTRRGRVGDSAVVPEGLDCAIGQNLVILRSDETHVDQRFLRWAARGPLWAEEVNRLRNVGAVFDSLNVRDLARIRVPTPPMGEQRAIAAVLGTLDDKIDSNRRLAVLLEETGSMKFRAQFFDTTVAWAEGTLSDLVDITMGQSPPGSSYTEDDDAGVLLVQGMGGFGDRYPSSDVYTTVPTRRAPPGSTLMTVRAPVGAVNVARTEVCLGRGVAGIRSKHPAFAEFLVRGLSSRWASEESGTIFPAVNRKQVLGLPVQRPPGAEIEAFERFASPIVSTLATLHDETEALTAIRDALLPELISGEIRVPDTADPEEVIGPAAEDAAAAAAAA